VSGHPGHVAPTSTSDPQAQPRQRGAPDRRRGPARHVARSTTAADRSTLRNPNACAKTSKHRRNSRLQNQTSRSVSAPRSRAVCSTDCRSHRTARVRPRPSLPCLRTTASSATRSHFIAFWRLSGSGSGGRPPDTLVLPRSTEWMDPRNRCGLPRCTDLRLSSRRCVTSPSGRILCIASGDRAHVAAV
jgi:hypothetical protein